jgi:hypothetical protein
VQRFWHANVTLWRDRFGGMSLAVTSLFWGAGAMLQFVVLAWAQDSLGLGLDQAAYLQGVVAVGITVGAAAAARFVSLANAPHVLPLGIAMGEPSRGRPPSPHGRTMKLTIATDAWEPQVNGVVRTLKMTTRELERRGHQVQVLSPRMFRCIPCPTYLEIALAITTRSKVARMIDAFDPDCLHIATEGPLGWMARSIATRRGWSFTTAYHSRFPEYVHARFRLPTRWSYALLRKFHNAAAAKARFPDARWFGLLDGDSQAEIYRSADVMVFPSVTDTFGLVMAESMACGTPVAAYPVPGPLDVVGRDSPGGVLDEDLRTACLAALRKPRAGVIDYASRFTWETATRQFEQALRPWRAVQPPQPAEPVLQV